LREQPGAPRICKCSGEKKKRREEGGRKEGARQPRKLASHMFALAAVPSRIRGRGWGREREGGRGGGKKGGTVDVPRPLASVSLSCCIPTSCDRGGKKKKGKRKRRRKKRRGEEGQK